MKKKVITKRILAVALSLIMMLGLMPITAYADGTYTFKAYTQSGDNNSTLRYYLTDDTSADVSISEINGYVDFRLTIADGWYFEKWETYFRGYKDVALWTDTEVEGSNPIGEDGDYTFFNKYGNNQPFVNEAGSGKPYIFVNKSTGFYGDHAITAVLKPIVTVNAGDGVAYVLTTNNPTTVSENQTAVGYKEDVTITYQIDEKYVFISADTTGTKNTDTSNFGTVKLSATEKPTSVGIYTRLKQQTVNFDANGGSGTMSAQTFEHSVAQKLTANSFTRTDYTFTGWNTNADGSGTAYADMASASFAPVNDGDSITLYAQWEETPITTSDYTVYFDANGGEEIEPITVTYDEKYGRLPSSAVKGLSGGDSNWYLVDENGNVTETKITRNSTVNTKRDHTLFVKRKVLAPTLTLKLTVPGGISDRDTYYIPDNSTRVLTATVGNMNDNILNYTYAWYKDGTLIDGENGSVLTLPGNVSDSGTYKVVVTATLKDGTGIIVTESTASAEKEQKVTIRHAANTLYYDANGGEGGPSSNYTGSDTITVQTEVPTRTGYLFMGWNTKADGGGESYNGGDSYTFVDDNENGGCKVTLYAQWLKTYDVYIGGTQITEANKKDVFGDGKVSYDSETGVLTLNGYTYEGDGYQYGSYEDSETGETEFYSAVIYSKDSITIELKGDNWIQNTFTDATNNQCGDGIVVRGDVTFNGNGSLSMTAAYGVYADKTVTVSGATINIDATYDGIVAYEGNVIFETDSDVIIEAGEDGIYAYKNISITDCFVMVDSDGDGIYSYDGSVVIDSTKTNISSIGPWLEGTKITIKAQGNYGIFAYNGLTVDEKLTVSSPENGSIGELTKKDHTYGTVIVDGAAAKEIVIEPLGYKVTISGLAIGMKALVPAGQSLNDAYCEMYDVEDFSEILDTQKEGYTFGGWYTDETCTDGNEFNFNDPVNADITIYAKWVSVTTDDTDDKNNQPTDNIQPDDDAKGDDTKGDDTKGDDTKGDDTKGDDTKPTVPTQDGNDTDEEDSTHSETTSPDTGDNSNIFLWIALVFIGGAVIILTVLDRKKKAERR